MTSIGLMAHDAKSTKENRGCADSGVPSNRIAYYKGMYENK